MSIPNNDANPETVPDKDAAADVYTDDRAYSDANAYRYTGSYPHVYAGPYSDTGEYDDAATYEYVDANGTAYVITRTDSHRAITVTDARGNANTSTVYFHPIADVCTRSDCESDRSTGGECNCSVYG
jgi:hypothetical protein